MELIETKQVDSQILSATDFHLFVGASGFEQRATNSLRFLDTEKIAHKIAFSFDDRKNAQRDINDRIFLAHKVELLDTTGNSGKAVADKFMATIDAVPEQCVRIFVDYSSMTRSWYGSLISSFRRMESKKRIECFFGYSPSVFENPAAPAPNQTVGPIECFGGLDTMEKPSALIVGLGYERDRAIGLLQYVDPAICFGLVADPPIDSRYLEVALKNNREFLDIIGKENQYKHPLCDLQRTGHLLLSLVWGLRDDYRIILAPLGVKPVSLMCFLLAMRYPELDVWRVTTGVKGGTPLREAEGSLLILQANFE